MTIVIEFFGLPGGGKSTICAEVVSQLRQRSVSVTDRSGLLSWQKGLAALDRLKIRLTSIVAIVINFDIFILYTLRTRPYSSVDLRRYFSFWSRRFYLRSFLSQHVPDVILLEQGAVQEVWSLFATCERYSKLAFRRLTGSVCDVEGLVYVCVPVDVAAQRVVGRGHGSSRFEGDNILEVTGAIQKQSFLFDIVADILRKKAIFIKVEPVIQGVYPIEEILKLFDIPKRQKYQDGHI